MSAGKLPLRIGHRGAPERAPDNSLEGIHLAASLGADMVEMDIRVTLDGIAVLHHGASLLDRGGKDRLISQQSYAEIQRANAGIPTLDQALRACKALGIGAYLDMKDTDAVGATMKVLQNLKISDKVIVSSFQADLLRKVRQLDPRIMTSILFRSLTADPIDLAKSCGANYVHPCWEYDSDPAKQLSPAWLARVRLENLGVITWHEERPEQISQLIRRQVDGICTDKLELFAKHYPQVASHPRKPLGLV